PHFAAEDADQMLTFQSLRLCIRSVTLQAKRVHCRGAFQEFVLSAMRFVAGGATLLEGRLVQMRLLSLLRLIRVTLQADADRIALGQSRIGAGMRAVTVGAIAGRAR